MSPDLLPLYVLIFINTKILKIDTLILARSGDAAPSEADMDAVVRNMLNSHIMSKYKDENNEVVSFICNFSY